MNCPHCGKKLNVGSLMGSQRTKAKSAAAKANGAKGGRPRKTPKSESPTEPVNDPSAGTGDTGKPLPRDRTA
jgi:hypothetical protein